MDEPTSAMDLSHESDLIANLKNQVVTQTILMITHRTSILELATRVLVLDQGKLVAQGPKSEFMRNQSQQQAFQQTNASNY